MSKTLIDIDDDLLALAQQALGTITKKATVNGALREVARRAAVSQFLEQARAGIFSSSQPTSAGTERASRRDR
jgi:Arc/MetJ family transcription regulator